MSKRPFQPNLARAWVDSMVKGAPPACSFSSDADPATSDTTDLASDHEPTWRVRDGLFGLVIALGGAFVSSGVLALLFKVGGVKHLQDSTGFNFSATFVQEAVFVVTALLFAYFSGGVTPAKFGLRRFKPSALGWVALAFVLYLAISAIYANLAHPPKDQLPSSFGVDQSALLAVATGVLVIGVAPFVEEFFFRGFIFSALRDGIGVWGGAVLSGAIFAAIHLKPQFFVPLMVLGVVLALLYQRTESLWPSIILHATNNALVFVYLIS